MASASMALDAVKGGSVDLFYSDPKNALVQTIPVEYDTRFTQAFQNLQGGGQQVLTLPPGSGIRDVVMVFGYSASALTALSGGATPAVGYALPKGWGYLAIDRVSWRVAGSSEYYLTGLQLMERNMRLVRTRPQADDLLGLGGNQVAVAGDYAKDQFAYIPLSFWKSPCVDGYEPALASDLLGSQIQIRVYMKTPAQFWASLPGATGGLGAVSAFSIGYFQVEQLNMINKAQSLAVHENMNEHTYVAPLRAFDQQELTAQIPAGSATGQGAQVTITGVMSGQVRAIQVFLTDNASGNANALVTQAPTSIRVSYSGVIYAQYDDGVSQIFNLLDSSKPSSFNTNQLTPAVGNTSWVTTNVLASYAMCPFAQPIEADEEAELLVAGKNIANGAITLQGIKVPDNTKDYTLHVVPILNGAIAYSRGSAQVLIG